jgi:hypothetical protein
MQFGLRQAMCTLQRNEMLHITPFYKVHNINALIMLSLLILFVFSKERLCCLNKDGSITAYKACQWISCRKNTGYHATDPKIRTQGAERLRSRIATKHGDGSLESSNALRTAERDAELYPGSGPLWWGNTPTSCLLVLQRDTSRGVQGLGYKALAGQRLKNLRAQLAAWRR